MITKQILIIDDEAVQAEALKKKIGEAFPDAEIQALSTEDEIEKAISERFYSLTSGWTASRRTALLLRNRSWN